MPSTLTSLHYHIVFGTKQRIPSIDPSWQSRLHEYLGGAIRSLGGVSHAVGGVSDHVHLLATLKPSVPVSTVLREVKRGSSFWVHQQIGDCQFGWQEGYGAFTVSRSNLARVTDYIVRQEEHHSRRTFAEEFQVLVRRHGLAISEGQPW